MCKLYRQATELHEQGVHVISTNEKTGIQALERLHPTRPMAAGKPEAPTCWVSGTQLCRLAALRRNSRVPSLSSN